MSWPILIPIKIYKYSLKIRKNSTLDKNSYDLKKLFTKLYMDITSIIDNLFLFEYNYIR